MAGVFGEALAGDIYHRALRVQIAKEMGWTLDAVDSLGMQDWLDVLAVTQALADITAFRLRG